MVVAPSSTGTSTVPKMADTLQGLHSSKSSYRLTQIAKLRARGIGDHINLPQLVVAGDQSAGKSSVLEGITGIPFPRQDGVCTKFPTEIILQHSLDETSIVATIIPCASRMSDHRSSLQGYRRQLQSFTELGETITEVGALMGIRGFGGHVGGPAFSEDVLRIEVSGPQGLHLTVVDLPGLIKVANEEQTEEDVQAVQNMVDSYLSNPWTIILAVVQASNDIANQAIIQKSRQFDKGGERTVGIITKPDLINAGTEKRISQLAKNEDTTKLNLGFYLVKNPTPNEIEEGVSPKEREEKEVRYFQSSPWKEQGLDRDRVGVVALRTSLQHLLDRHIERELPKVRQELTKLMNRTEQEILSLGEERPTVGHLRMFLCRLAMQFQHLCNAGLNGTYHESDPSFFQEESNQRHSRRLRATVQRLNTQFSDYMRDKGEKRKVGEPLPVVDDPLEFIGQEPELPKSAGLEEDDDIEEGQMTVTSSEMKIWIKEVYISTKGKELSGNHNHTLLSELFHVQSSRWETVAHDHVMTVYDEIVTFVKTVLQHLTSDEQVLTELLDITATCLVVHKTAAEEELTKIFQDEKQHPQTYNHYYTDNIQNERLHFTRTMVDRLMKEVSQNEFGGKLHVSNTTVDGHRLLKSLKNRINVDMDGQACEEALTDLKAYYKVARKTIVDNICRQVIERHLLSPLVCIFSPESVAGWDDEVLHRVAAERAETSGQRKRLQGLLEDLRGSVTDLRR